MCTGPSLSKAPNFHVFSLNLHMSTLEDLSPALLITQPELMYLGLEAATALKYYFVNQHLPQ